MSKQGKLAKVAYFSMEFGLHEDFKIYSGGLGILAGDHLKAAKDGQYPLVAIGMLWRQGYTTQTIGKDGQPFDAFPVYKYDFLKDTGVKVNLRIRGRQVWVKVWLCEEFGNVPLYLMDTYLPENSDWYITGQLYGWFSEERIAQEMVLSIGGIRALRALKLDIDLYHFNDSHPVLAGTELIQEKMNKNGISFEDAWKETRQQILFTTHTPVVAGNEVHEHELLNYMGAYNGLTHGQMVKLGGEPFSMTVAGLRLSKRANAVAQLHGETAKEMWMNITNSSEIIAITNGVHNGTWQDDRIVKAHKAKQDLWAPHMEAKIEMIKEVFDRTGITLDENVLTIGFARRAAPYKRSDLIFQKKAVIEKLLKEKKLQIIFSGKAHPNDFTGKQIVANLFKMSKKHPETVIFLQDYDMKIGKLLTRGCDVWLNNPIRPMEASGTSGMKAAMNGVLNCSTLDGWWPEGCEHGVTGWQFGDAYVGKDQDKVDLEGLFKVLLGEVIPTFYDNRTKWLEMMNASIEMSTWKFSAARMVEEYYNEMYVKK